MVTILLLRLMALPVLHAVHNPNNGAQTDRLRLTEVESCNRQRQVDPVVIASRC